MAKHCSVSVIVPICNVQKYLRDCLISLSCQTLQDIEFICIDDGSTDESLAILNECVSHDPRFKIISKPNAGYGNTMNRGLDVASGEYIGIVESDDFASEDMFKDLYFAAKTHNLDVIKSNFYAHTSCRPAADDELIENLVGCTYDTVFTPREDSSIFLVQPAIWSGLYKRSFLDEYNIRFLETPGASFQDTSFNFKVFAAATRAMCIKDAYLHYRIDNSSSSVKNPHKVFCIADEYDEIWRFAREHDEIYSALKYLIPQIQFGGYLWNSDRLSQTIRPDFYKYFIDRYKTLQQKGLLREEFFSKAAWEDVQSMLSSPDNFYSHRYGSPTATHAVLILANTLTPYAVSRLSEILGSLSEDVECYLWAKENSESVYQKVAKGRDRLPGVHFGSEVFASGLVQEIDFDAISAETLTILAAGPKARPSDWDHVSTLVAGKQRALKSTQGLICNTVRASDWKDSGIPAWCCLLLSGMTTPSILPLSDSPAWLVKLIGTTLHGAPEEEADVPLETKSLLAQQYLKAVDSFRSIYENLLSIASSYEDKLQVLALFNAIWKELKSSYDRYPYETRKIIGERPSSAHLSVVEAPTSNTPSDEPKLSVIIPAYNSATTIGACLDSVLNQTLRDIEVFVINDGSSDETLDVVEKRAKQDPRIQIITQLNGGAGSARNRAIQRTSGKYLAFIDSDDYYPSSDSLEKLYSAALKNHAAVCGGSFGTDINGKLKTAFGGVESFYTIRTEGFHDFSELASDYGWIRFIYRRDVFDDKSVRFPELEWYEDPVFLCNVMERCPRFYGITDVTYMYRYNSEKNEWTAPKVRDLLRGIEHDLDFASRHNEHNGLYSVIVSKINWDYCDAIASHLTDPEVLTRVCALQATLELAKINNARDWGLRTYILRPLGVYSARRDNAIVRIAKRTGNSLIYRKLQDAVRRTKSK